MPYEKSDAEILCHIARRLFAEGRAMFREAHAKGMQSFNAPTVDEHLKILGEAIEEERRAFEKQREAFELRREALRLHEEALARREAARGR